MRFDWYQTTIEAKPREVVQTIGKLGHELRTADSLAKRYRYSQGWAVHHAERGVVAHVFAGGNGDKPHAFASSEATDDFVALVRQEWSGRHLVTRADAAEDFNESGAYERLKKQAKRVAKERRLRFQSFEDELNPNTGRTQYIGSPTSDYRARLYEKGWEQVQKLLLSAKVLGKVEPGAVVSITNTATGEQVNPADWVRLELQARPKDEEARRLAAAASPEELWGFTEWAQQLAREAMALDLERLYIRTRKVSKDEEALRWMCQQYAGPMARLAQSLGGFPELGVWLSERIAEVNERKG